MEIFFLLGFFPQENILSASQYSEFFLSECASKVNERRLFDLTYVTFKEVIVVFYCWSFSFVRNITTYGASQSKVTLSVEPTEVKMCLHSFALVEYPICTQRITWGGSELNVWRNFIDFVGLLSHFLSISCFFLCRAGSYNMAENRFLSTVLRRYSRIALLVCKACIALRWFPVNYF